MTLDQLNHWLYFQQREVIKSNQFHNKLVQVCDVLNVPYWLAREVARLSL